jgi:hypothetical protein
MSTTYPAPGTTVRMRCSRCQRINTTTIPRRGDWGGCPCNCGSDTGIWWSHGELMFDGYSAPVREEEDPQRAKNVATSLAVNAIGAMVYITLCGWPL